MIEVKHFTDSTRNVISWAADNVVEDPGGTPEAVFRRPLTTLQISDSINKALIHFIKKLEVVQW